MQVSKAYIVAGLRTAGGRRGGRLSGWHPVDMGAAVLDGLLGKVKVDPALIDDVIFGCVGQAGQQSANVARNVVLASTLPESVPGTSIDRQCGSSQQAVHFAAQAVMSGTMDIVIAGGVESMSQVPMGLPMTLPFKHGFGSYLSPNIQERYNTDNFSQFVGADMIAKKYNFSREELDQFAVDSHRKACKAIQDKLFDDEILPLAARIFDPKTGTLTVPGDMHTTDEGVRCDASIEKMSALKPILEGGFMTAGGASQMCDGASGVIIANERGLKLLGVQPLACIHHISVMGHDPVIMLEAPLPATDRALRRAGLTIDDIDLFEINEAFASVPMAWLKHTKADPSKLNVNGGAIALGHPLGGSGTKLMTTLLHALKKSNKRYGLQSMCEGGGMANVTIIENMQ